jgi:hypothetical protein
MAKRQKSAAYTAPEMAAVKTRLAGHKARLVDELAAQLACPMDFNVACAVRGLAEKLVTTCMVLGNLDDTTRLAELTGTAQPIPFLNECGMD